jgi:hypothetical protein
VRRRRLAAVLALGLARDRPADRHRHDLRGLIGGRSALFGDLGLISGLTFGFELPHVPGGMVGDLFLYGGFVLPAAPARA